MPDTGAELDFIIKILQALEGAGPVNQTKLARLTGSNKNKIGRYIETLSNRVIIKENITKIPETNNNHPNQPWKMHPLLPN